MSAWGGGGERRWWVHLIQGGVLSHYVMEPIITTAETPREAEEKVIATQMASRGIFPGDYVVDPDRPTRMAVS